MIMKLLEIRTFLLRIYQKARFIINPIVKFIVSIMVFSWINSEIGFDARFSGKTVMLLLSVICAVTPAGVLVFLAMLLILLNVYKASMILAILLLLMFIVMYGLLMRFSPKQAIAAIAVPVLTRMNLHYCVPLVLGAVSTPLSILPMTCGAMLYSMVEIVKVAALRQINLKDLDAVLGFFTDVADAFLADKQMIITVVVFALVTVAVFVIRQFTFDFAFVISLGAGVVVNILGFLVADLHYDVTVSVGLLLLMSLLSGVIAHVIEFFQRVLDYSGIERVQFEDDDYYYYVKAVPKVNVSIPRHNVKRMSDYEDDDEEEDEEYDTEEESREAYEEYLDGYTVSGIDEENLDEGYIDVDNSEGNYSDSDDGGDIRYEEYDVSDFNEKPGATAYSPIEFEDDDDDLELYGIRRVGDSQPASGILPIDDDDEGYEVEMTLDDEP